MQHCALGLTQDVDLRHQLMQLIDDYDFHWGLVLKGAIHYASERRASFLLVDMDDPATNWKNIVIALKSNPATRRIPIMGIAQDASKALMADASNAQINGPIARADLANRLPDWVKRRARVWDEDYYGALGTACTGDLPPLVQKGIEQFNAHDFWEAHETLEHAWIDVRPHPVGEVYRSILQVGVAYYQIQQGNYAGAVKMFLRSIQWLDPLPDACHGIDLRQFKADAAAVRAALERLGAERLHEFDHTLFKPIPFVQKPESA